ncbi:MAG: dihydroorotate dehydrogenase electron transfer subunit [Clostridia bacterium]|nr:dihydroorotate dehydrogenase electron transfer subunit [Clostridia bacterium]
MIARIESVRPLNQTIFRMDLSGTFPAMRPGQFAQLEVPGLYLRRPISLCDFDGGHLTLVIRAVGEGTKRLQCMQVGEKLDVLCPLGNGFDTEASGDTPLLVGGGVGLPPMLALCKALLAQGKHPKVIVGFANADDAFLLDEFAALGVSPAVSTVDGSLGTKGFVTDVMPEDGFTYLYACGPKPMLRALWERTEGCGEYSLEERMGCGFGACMGCAVKTASGVKRVCFDGPVFTGKELVW